MRNGTCVTTGISSLTGNPGGCLTTTVTDEPTIGGSTPGGVASPGDEALPYYKEKIKEVIAVAEDPMLGDSLLLFLNEVCCNMCRGCLASTRLYNNGAWWSNGRTKHGIIQSMFVVDV
jgi:hypothetical protein